MNASEESPTIIAFRNWLQNNGAYIHPSVIFAPGKYGSSVFTTAPLEQDCKIVSCPFDLIITAKVAQDALQSLSTAPSPLKARDALCTYLILHSEDLHDKISKSKGPDWVGSVLRHQEYINTLPHDGLMTPLFFTEEELTLLHGTNLYHATMDRKREWYTGWQRVRQWLHGVVELEEEEFTWVQFLRARTWLSSRAFPSSLMADPPSLSSKNAVPMLVPLVDALNHARGTPISWSIDKQEEDVNIPSQVTSKSLSLVSHQHTGPFEEMFNNYGAKPNDEFLLGYGFTLANNPEDVLHLKLPGSERPFRIIRAALGLGEAQAVWDEIGRRLQEGFATDEDDLDIAFAELQLEIGQILPEMLRDLKVKLPLAAFEPSLPGIRPEVREMVWNYVDGQREILDDLLAFAETRLKAAIESAQELGIYIALEPDEDDSE